jgi:hypothetical protein
MKLVSVGSKCAALMAGVCASLSLTSCNPPQAAAPAAPPVAPAPEHGRYQIVVASEGDRNAVLFLVDTKDGNTWIYRPPNGPAINGFWSDIPRLTYAPDYWQRVFTQQGQGTPQPSTAPATAPGPTK